MIALLEKYPASMKKPISILNTFVHHYRETESEWLYEGDLEMDFLKFLGQVQRLVKEKPGDVEADFSAGVRS